MKISGFTLAMAAATMASAATPAFCQDANSGIVYAPGTGENMAPLPDTVHHGARAGFGESADRLSAMADDLSNPVTQDRLSDIVEGVSSALMQMRIGPFAEAIDHVAPGTVDRRIGPDTTLGDIAGPGSGALPERFGEHSRDALIAMGGTMRALAAMMPELQRVEDELKDSAHRARDRH